MKFFTVLMLLFLTICLLGESYPVMLKMNSQSSISNDIRVSFRSGIEEVLTQNGYSLIDEFAQNQALKEQASQRKQACYDDACLISTGKMLAAKALFIVDVIPMKKDYLFKIRLIDFETGETKSSTTAFYANKDLENPRKINLFAQTISKKILKIKLHQKSKPAPKKVEKKVENNIEKKISVKEDTTHSGSDFLVPYLSTDITASSDLKYLNLGFGIKLLSHHIFNRYSFELKGSVYRDMANSYFYSDVALRGCLHFLKDSLYLGAVLPLRILFSDDFESKIGFLPGLLVGYTLFRKGGFFINLEVIPFLAITSGDLKGYVKTGLNIGFNLF